MANFYLSLFLFQIFSGFLGGASAHIEEDRVTNENRHTKDTLPEEHHVSSKEEKEEEEEDDEYDSENYDVEGGGMVQWIISVISFLRR